MMYYDPNQSFMGAAGWGGWGGGGMQMNPFASFQGMAGQFGGMQGGFGSPMGMMPQMMGGGGFGGYWTPQRMQNAQPMGGIQAMPEGGGQGAGRPGMQYRADRRQAKRGGGYNAEAAPASAQQPQQPQQGWANNANAQPGMETIRGFFDSPFGRLTTASGGNANVFKAQGGDENTLYHYDPNAGWKSMTGEEYRGYGDGARGGQGYADPSQFAGAGAVKQQFQRTNVPANRRGY